MAKKLYEESNIQAIANAIREKNGTTTKYKTSEMPNAVKAIQTGIEPVENTWNQIPTAVKNYLDNVTYDPSDYTTSRIAEFAPSTADVNNTYPTGKTIAVSKGVLDRNGYEIDVASGNITVYNDIPNQYTEYTVRNNGAVSQVGTLKPTGFLRQIKCETNNVRDLGGWACDGGTVKYGKLFRGGEFKEADLDIFLNQLGIRHELNLRGKSEAEQTTTILRDYVDFTCPDKYVWHSITDKVTWKEILRCIFDCVKKNKPLFFHCSAGADRTGTVASIIEAILGVGQSDVDKDYELTCFSTGTSTDTQARRRNESDWQGQINAINALTVGDTFRDKVLNWVASMGFAVDEINAFRNAMIDGTPDTISLSIGSHSITNNLTNVNNSNATTNIATYQSYEANITVPLGYVMESINVTMDGTDITNSVFTGTKTNLRRSITRNATNCSIDGNKTAIDGESFVATITANSGYTLDGGTVTITMGGIDVSTYYSNGKIAIPNVTGNIVITATAVESAPNFTNIYDAETMATDEYLNKRINSSGSYANANGYFSTPYIPLTANNGDTLTIRTKNVPQQTSGYGYCRLIVYESGGTTHGANNNIPGSGWTVTEEANGVYAYSMKLEYDITQFRAALYMGSSPITASDVADVIITVNEPIE